MNYNCSVNLKKRGLDKGLPWIIQQGNIIFIVHALDPDMWIAKNLGVAAVLPLTALSRNDEAANLRFQWLQWRF